MSLEYIPHIDQTFGESDEPVTTRYGIQTGNGTLRLVGASFSGDLPNNDMPPEITIERAGGNNDTTDKYLHFLCTQRASEVRQQRILSLESDVRRLTDKLDDAELYAMLTDETVAYLRREVDRLQRPALLRLTDRIRAFFGGER